MVRVTWWGTATSCLSLWPFFVSCFYHLVPPVISSFPEEAGNGPTKRLCDLTKARVISPEGALAVPAAVLAGACRLLRPPVFPSWQQIVQAARQAGSGCLATGLILEEIERLGWKLSVNKAVTEGVHRKLLSEAAMALVCVFVCALRCAFVDMCDWIYLG